MPTARKTKPLDDPWMSLVQAAKALGTTRQTVLTRAIKGEIEAKFIAGRTVVSRESVQRAKAQAEAAT